MKFRYVQNLESDEPIMLLNKHIGYDKEDGMGIDGSLFQEELLALDSLGKKRIQVWINSVGGIVMDGYNICNAILKSETRVDTYCMGMAASIAGVIFQCGRKRVMADYGILMYHNPYAGEKNESPLLDSMKNSLNKVIEQRSGMTTDAVHRMMDRTSFIEAREAEKLKLCDEVEMTVLLNTKNFPKEARASLTEKDARNYAKEANKVLNKIFNNSDMPLLKVTNRLKLNDDANEESIVKGIDEVVNKAVTDATAVLNKKSKEEVDKMKNDMDEAEDKYKKEMDKMKADYEACKNELEAEKNKLKDIEDKAAEEKAKNMVSDHVKEGKIKNEPKVIADWTAKAKADMLGVKAMLESIPTNKTAAKFVVNKITEVKDANPVATAMAKLEAKMDQKK